MTGVESAQAGSQPSRGKTLTVITPTISRPTLKRALLSAQPDEWLVIGDGPQPEAARIVAELGEPYHYLEGPYTGHKGNAQRDLGMRLATGDFLLFLDDDDIFTPGALDMIRPYLAGGWPVIFRMRHNGHVIWQSQELCPGEVGGSMLCVPNDRVRLARWAAGTQAHASDLEFIRATLAGWPAVVWAGEVIVECNPERNGDGRS